MRPASIRGHSRGFRDETASKSWRPSSGWSVRKLGGRSFFLGRPALGRGKGSGAVLGTPLVILYSQDMPRPRRAAEGGLIDHALNRANARLAIFQTDEDYAASQRVLAEAVVRHHMRLPAYCLMPNRFHVLLWPREDGDPSRFMSWLTMTHTQRWHACAPPNGRHRSSRSGSGKHSAGSTVRFAVLPGRGSEPTGVGVGVRPPRPSAKGASGRILTPFLLL